MQRFKSNHQESWCSIGDFNQIIHPYEMEQLRPPNQNMIGTFKRFLCHKSLEDMLMGSCRFTWSNYRGKELVKERIDRVVVNWDWMQKTLFNMFLQTLL